MFCSVQFPIVDTRRFLVQSERLGYPEWPLPTPNSEFVRFFGTIRDRALGGLLGGFGEDRICEANRAFSLKPPSSLLLSEGSINPRVLFRRFYFDGLAMGKFEVGFDLSPHYPSISLKELGTQLLHIPVRVRNASGSPVNCDLAEAGKHIANLYLAASTPTKKTVLDKNKWQVRAGIPILFLQTSKYKNLTIPKEAISINLPDWPLRLYHYGIPYRGGKIYTWILQSELSKIQQDISRTLRLYLLRLNAEHECLRLILQNITNKNIEITRGTIESDNLQWYLDKTLKRIKRLESTSGNVNEQIAEIARQSINTIRPGQLDILLENVNDYRRHIREKIENYANKDASIINYGYMEVRNMENKQGNTYNLSNFKAGILNIESKLTNVSQSIRDIPSFDQSLKDELKQLIEQLNVALQKAPIEKIDESEALVDTTKNLVEDISKDKPNKAKIQLTLEGLKKAAENIASVLPEVLPIVIQISMAVAKAFGLR